MHAEPSFNTERKKTASTSKNNNSKSNENIHIKKDYKAGPYYHAKEPLVSDTAVVGGWPRH